MIMTLKFKLKEKGFSVTKIFGMVELYWYIVNNDCALLQHNNYFFLGFSSALAPAVKSNQVYNYSP